MICGSSGKKQTCSACQPGRDARISGFSVSPRVNLIYLTFKVDVEQCCPQHCVIHEIYLLQLTMSHHETVKPGFVFKTSLPVNLFGERQGTQHLGSLNPQGDCRTTAIRWAPTHAQWQMMLSSVSETLRGVLQQDLGFVQQVTYCSVYPCVV